MTARRTARRSEWRSVDVEVVVPAVAVGFGVGVAAETLTAPTLRSAATPAAPTALKATAANGFIFVLTSGFVVIGRPNRVNVQDEATLSDAGRCDVSLL